MTDPITLALCGALLWPNAETVKDCTDWVPAAVVEQMCEKPGNQIGWVYQDCSSDGTLCYCRKPKFIKEE